MKFRDAKGRFMKRKLYAIRAVYNVARQEYWDSLAIAKHNDLVWC